MQCPSCGASIPEGARSCLNCGRVFAPTPSPEGVELPAAQQIAHNDMQPGPAASAPAQPLYPPPSQPLYGYPSQRLYGPPSQPYYAPPSQPYYGAPQSMPLVGAPPTMS